MKILAWLIFRQNFRELYGEISPEEIIVNRALTRKIEEIEMILSQELITKGGLQ